MHVLALTRVDVRRRNFNPFMTGASIVDCGDVPISPYDNTLALDQIETAYTTLLSRDVATDFTKGER